MGGYGIAISSTCKDPVRAIKFLDFLASDEVQVLNNWGIEGKHYMMKDGKRVVPQEVQDRINNDNTAFTKESGIGFYWNMMAHYGDGAKDPSGNYYTKNFPEQLVAATATWRKKRWRRTKRRRGRICSRKKTSSKSKHTAQHGTSPFRAKTK